ncbi:transporter substrate-binding domain-containing protein [Devosia nitrariae]|uniref:Amino acid ABC transporter n=1 Tax=Devosia nitrariae TaxID=2071872 RepID=A0ABQ5VZD1_9HYPH|nr:transporter substrate-binding domain-containing protein [Devosia nitrariae]GLQ53154.1 amino acid ABC transporter [Devosia nitrariae]
MCRRRSILAVLLGLWTGCAVGQTLPNHVDPSARDILPDLTSLPAIRFLTTADFPPFNYRDENGALVGFNIDLARRICAEVDVPCTIQTWPWEQAANALADKQGDALIAGLALTAENGERFDFSAIYLALPGRFVTRADAARDFNPSDLDGRTISVREGSAHEEFLHRYLPDVEVTASEDEIAALQAVESGQADVYFGDAMRASFWLNDNLACCSFAGEAYFRPDLFGQGLAIALPAGHDSVRHAIDWALVRLKRSGSLDELYLRWFPIGFY